MASKEYYKWYYQKHKEIFLERNRRYYQLKRQMNIKRKRQQKTKTLDFIHLEFDKDFNIIIILD